MPLNRRSALVSENLSANRSGARRHLAARFGMKMRSNLNRYGGGISSIPADCVRANRKGMKLTKIEMTNVA